MKVAIIKYNAGNTKSVEHALTRFNIHPVITDDIEQIQSADKVIFPGVGHAQPTMQFLKERNLDKVITNLKQPVLGICLGQQLMCSFSEEGNTTCLNIFPIQVKRFVNNIDKLKIPHMGWNNLINPHFSLFKNLDQDSFVYFVHSYYCELSEYNIATCNYILPFSAALHKDNFYAVQFHPEKSADVGAVVIENFLNIN